MTVTPTDVVLEARSWLGTPWRHMDTRKGRGVDCLMMLVEIGKALGLPGWNEPIRAYSRIPDAALLKAETDRRLIPLGQLTAREIKPAYVGLFWYAARRVPQHYCLFAEHPSAHGSLSMIHTYLAVGRVVEHIYSPVWERRLIGVYAVPGVEYQHG